MRELRIDTRRKLRGEGGDLFRNRLELGEMRCRIPAVKLAVGDERETLPQGTGECPMRFGGFSHGRKKSLRRGLRTPRLFGRFAFVSELSFGFQPVVMHITRQPVVAALFGDEIGARRDVIVSETRRF